MNLYVIFSDIDKSEYAGQPRISVDLVRAFKKNGFNVSIISNAINFQNIPAEFMNGDNVVLKGPGTFRTYLLGILRVLKILWKRDDVRLVIQGQLLAVFFFPIACLLRKRLVVATCENIETHSAWLRGVICYVFGLAEKIFVTSEYAKNQLIRHGISEEKILVVYLGLRDIFLSEKFSDQNSTLFSDILFWGDSSFERGFDVVLKLAKTFPDKTFKVMIRWKERDQINSLQELLRLKNTNVLFYPYEQPLIEHVVASSIVVLPFRYMNVRPPLSILEAMALAKCVITSRMSGNEEFVDSGRNGLMLNFDDEWEKSVCAIKELLFDPKLRLRMGGRARLDAIALSQRSLTSVRI